MASSRIRAFSSSVGMKVLIGVSGLALFLYLIIHIAGNLMVFGGPSAFNGYARMMASNPLLPAIEIGLLLVFLVHIFLTVRMFLNNQQARPVGYVQKRNAGKPSRKNLASTTMIVSGLWLTVFLVIHVKAFRFTPMYDWAEGGHDLYRLEMDNFRSPFITTFYVLSMLVIGSHLWHGISSGFQSLGADHPRWTRRLLIFGRTMAVLIAGGFMVIALWAHFVGSGARS